MIDDEVKDTVTYTMKNRFIFRPDLSNGLTGEEILTVPNMVILGASGAVKRDRAPMLPLVMKAMKLIFNDPKTIFIKIKAMDLMFNGFEFECEGKEFAARALCNGLKTEGAQVKVVNETFLSVSLLGHVSKR